MDELKKYLSYSDGENISLNFPNCLSNVYFTAVMGSTMIVPYSVLLCTKIEAAILVNCSRSTADTVKVLYSVI